jgi:hypothetical protein
LVMNSVYTKLVNIASLKRLQSLPVMDLLDRICSNRFLLGSRTPI